MNCIVFGDASVYLFDSKIIAKASKENLNDEVMSSKWVSERASIN